MKTKKFGDAIYIEWIDSVEQTGWREYNEVIETDNEEWLCKTRACYIGEDKDFVIVAHTVGATEDNAILGVLKIPKKSILKIR